MTEGHFKSKHFLKIYLLETRNRLALWVWDVLIQSTGPRVLNSRNILFTVARAAHDACCVNSIYGEALILIIYWILEHAFLCGIIRTTGISIMLGRDIKGNKSLSHGWRIWVLELPGLYG